MKCYDDNSKFFSRPSLVTGVITKEVRGSSESSQALSPEHEALRLVLPLSAYATLCCPALQNYPHSHFYLAKGIIPGAVELVQSPVKRALHETGTLIWNPFGPQPQSFLPASIPPVPTPFPSPKPSALIQGLAQAIAGLGCTPA